MPNCTSTMNRASQRTQRPTARLIMSKPSASRSMSRPLAGKRPDPVTGPPYASIPEHLRTSVHLAVIGIDHVAANAVTIIKEALRDPPDQLIIAVTQPVDHSL